MHLHTCTLVSGLASHIMIILGPPSNVFSASAYFVNSNTELLSDLVDNYFSHFAERILLFIRLNNAGKVGLRFTYIRCPFWQKNLLFR